jgi:hypothetical protein
MKQGEVRSVALGENAAVLRECSNTENVKIPRLTLHVGQYAEEGNTYPAQTATVFGQCVRDLYEMLRGYYSERP